jgi:hypothetical protein
MGKYNYYSLYIIFYVRKWLTRKPMEIREKIKFDYRRRARKIKIFIRMLDVFLHLKFFVSEGTLLAV